MNAKQAKYAKDRIEKAMSLLDEIPEDYGDNEAEKLVREAYQALEKANDFCRDRIARTRTEEPSHDSDRSVSALLGELLGLPALPYVRLGKGSARVFP